MASCVEESVLLVGDGVVDGAIDGDVVEMQCTRVRVSPDRLMLKKSESQSQPTPKIGNLV